MHPDFFTCDSGLPKPKAPEIPDAINDQEDELEDFVKKKETPVEKPPPKKRMPKKITIPSLAQVCINNLS